MSRKIWKAQLDIRAAVQDFKMPAGAKLRHVGIQDAMIGLWFEVVPENQPVTRYAYVLGTGFEIPAYIPVEAYAGSVISHPYVWHVYVIPEHPPEQNI